MADQSLNSATHHCLGRPLPHQLANAPRAHPKVTAYAAFQTWIMRFMLLSGISTCFQVVSQSLGQIAHVLLTHPPLASNKSSRRNLWIQLARLACIRHAASVRPEPGSNSQFENWVFLICSRLFACELTSLICLDQTMFDPHTAKLCSVFKVPTCVKWRNVLYLTRLLTSCQQVFWYLFLSCFKHLARFKTNNTLPCFFFFVNFCLLIVFSAKRQEVL